MTALPCDAVDQQEDVSTAVEDQEEQQATQPDDLPPAWLLRAIFSLLGVGILVPWNVFISAKDYFLRRYCYGDTTDENLLSTFATLYNLSSVSTLVLVVSLQWFRDRRQRRLQRVRDIESTASLSTELDDSVQEHATENSNHALYFVIIPLSIYVVIFLGQSLLVFWVSLPVGWVKTLTLLSLATSGICGALATSGIVAAAGPYPSDVGINPFLAGQSAGGVAVAVVNYLAAIYDTDNQKSFWETMCEAPTNVTRGEDIYSLSSDTQPLFMDASSTSERLLRSCLPYIAVDYTIFVYFALAALVSVACLVGFTYIDRLPKHGEISQRAEYETIQDHAPTYTTDVLLVSSVGRQGSPVAGESSEIRQEQEGLLLDLENSTSLTGTNPQVGALVTPTITILAQGDPQNTETGHHDAESTDAPPQEEPEFALESIDNINATTSDTMLVWQHIQVPALCIYIVFLITLAVFPGWTSELRSVYQCESHWRPWNDLYTPGTFVVFNVGDLFGRLLFSKLDVFAIRNLPRKLAMVSAARIFIFPLFYLCAMNHHDNKEGGGYYIPTDLYSTVVQLIFAVTNGLFVSTAYCVAPTLLPNISNMNENHMLATSRERRTSTTSVSTAEVNANAAVSKSHQERMSEILTLALSLGLLSGSFMSYPVSKMVE